MLFQKGFELKRTAKMGIWDLLFKQIWFEGKINLFLFLIILDDFIFLLHTFSLFKRLWIFFLIYQAATLFSFSILFISKAHLRNVRLGTL